ncbi:protein kinase [Streptomyces sp. NPDC056637]|uniref:serine/threonine-protein kinase n=1 Tax=unclassified Streptomyces TaxID=2593676 RepID=UPI00369CEBD4
MLSPLAHDDPAEIGAYRLVARLGSGGMGTVYLARTASGRTAALKTMHARIAADPESRTRFRLEIDAARVIGGRYGAQVFDADAMAATPWLATEYVLGPPLGEAVTTSGPLPQAAVRALGAALCEALAQLHSSDVVHRDLKPSNIMVTADGPRLIDFGIARAIGDDRLTRTGAAAGTPAFMSPEQATGVEHTAAGDVFALAGVLVFAATGRAPFGSGQAADLLYRVRYAEADLAGMPPALASVLAMCLSKEPDRRPSTAELREQLAGPQGEFASHLPDPLLLEIGRRATEVWRTTTHRLPSPASSGHAYDTTVHSARSVHPSRRKLLIGGGSLLALSAAGAGAWAWARSGPDRATPVALWRTAFQAPAAPRHTPPMVVGDTVVVDTAVGVRGFRADTGDDAWNTTDTSGPWRAATDGERLYALAPVDSHPYGFTVSAVNPSDGSAQGSAILLDRWAGGLKNEQLLAVGNGQAFAVAGVKTDPDRGSQATTNPKSWSLIAIDLATGKAVWDEPLAHPPASEQRFSGARAVGDHLVVINESGAGPAVTVYDAATGATAWTRRAGKTELHGGRSELAADDKRVFWGGEVLRAQLLTDGRTLWTYHGRAAFGAPVVQDGVVYAVEADATRPLVAVDAATGKLLWRENDSKASAGSLDVAPVVGKTYVYKHSGTGICAVNTSSRTPAWTVRAEATSLTVQRAKARLFAVADRSLAALPLE